MKIPKRRILYISSTAVIVSASLYLLLTLLNEQLQVYYSPSKLLTVPYSQQSVRVGGFVEKQSVEHIPDTVRVKFNVTDDHVSLPVVYDGILPALFKEGQMSVVQGHYDGHVFYATQVLAKHDENYQPPMEGNA